MADVLPLFPLNTVLFPGVPLLLHVFEDRYRRMVGELVSSGGPGRFGIVGIRAGSEVGDEDPDLYGVGCVAELRRATPYADGRYDVITTGGPRFRLVETDDSLPYLCGTVVYVGDPPGVGVDEAADGVRRAFPVYRAAVAAVSAKEVPDVDVGEADPVLLSWRVAAALHVDLPEKQHLLEFEPAADRLRYEETVLRRETALLRRAASAPTVATEGPFSLN